MNKLVLLLLLTVGCRSASAAPAPVFPPSLTGNNTFSGQNTFSKPIVGGMASPVFLTVSPRGILPGTSAILNDGAQFGPDTPGTKTCGLQEALNTMPQSTLYGPNVASVGLRLAPGYFYYTNVLWFSNACVTAIKIEGNTCDDTKLVYAGAETGTNCITISGFHPGTLAFANFPLHVVIRDVGFSALVNTTNTLLCVTNMSYITLQDCNFTGWEIMLNQIQGAQMSIAGITGVNFGFPGLVGANIQMHGCHLCELHNVFFANLATGAYLDADHHYCYNVKSAFIGKNSLFDTGNLWPNTSPFSLGAVILQTYELDSTYYCPHFYETGAGIVTLNSLEGHPGAAVILVNPDLESGDYSVGIVEPYQGQFIVYGQYGTADPSYTEGIVSTNPWSISAAPATFSKWSLHSGDTIGVEAVNLGSAGVITMTGTGSPNSVHSAPLGSIYLRSDGGAGTSFYVKESGGTGATGWVGK